MHDEPDNAVEALLWGRVRIHAATAFLRMVPHGLAHRMIHELKYKENQLIGETLGGLFGEELMSSNRMSGFDVILPVPLHPKKKMMRGYNQCQCIAVGLAEATGKTVGEKYLVRARNNESQTRKGRVDRWKNSEGLFECRHEEDLKGAHILLLDDVITTGATIEACALEILNIPGVRLSIAALAVPIY
jgi:ComF family protein